MKLNISELIKNPGAKEAFAFILADLPSDADMSFVQPVSVRGEVINTGHGLDLNAHVQTRVLSRCDCCLEEVSIPLEFDFSEEYVPEAQVAEDNEEEGMSLVMTYSGDWLDLSEAVKENLVLNLPMRIVCDPECPGICPSCGKNLKEGQCGCIDKDIDPRLSILAKLKNQ